MRSPSEALEARLPGLLGAYRSALAGGRHGPATPGGPLSRREAEAVGAALLRLQRGLTGERRLPGSGYMDSPDLLGAYLLYYWPVSYLQVSLALAWLARRQGGLPRLGRVLDLGAGPGPAAAALADAGALDLTLVDSSPAALALAATLLPTASTRTIAANLEDLEDATSLGQGFDLLVACHSLNELWHGRSDGTARRLALLGRLASLLAPGGILLLLEPSLLLTSRDLLALRDGLVPDLEVLGPCLRQGACPALAAGPCHTCHAEVPWSPPEPVATLAGLAGLDRSSLKTTWVALGRPEARPGVRGQGASRPLATSSGPTEALVVSEGLRNKAGRLRYLLCSELGRFPLSCKDGDPGARAQGFFGLGRHDRIVVEAPEERGQPGSGPAWGLGPATNLKVTRAPGPGEGLFP